MLVRSFFIVAFLFGSLFVFIVPPFQVADEFNHFYRAWQVSDGILVGIRTADNRLGGDLPVSVAKITQPFRSLPFHLDKQIKSNTIFYNLSVPLDENKREFVDFANTAIYAPTAYLPQVVAITIGKCLKIGPLSIFYLSRFLTLLFWLSMVYAALKILPFHKNLFAALALLPSSLFINASASGDVVTNACSFLFIALCLKMIVKNVGEVSNVVKNVGEVSNVVKNVGEVSNLADVVIVEKKWFSQQTTLVYIALIFLTSLVMSLNKMAYFPLVFLIFLIKKEHVNGLKNKMIIATTLIVSNLATIAFWSKIIQPIYLKFEDYNPFFRVGQQLNENVDPSLQMHFIVQNPLFFTKIAVFSVLKTLPHTVIHYVGKFGWEKNYLPIWLIGIIILLLIIQSMTNEKNQAVQGDSSNERLDLTLISDLKFKISNSTRKPLNFKFQIFNSIRNAFNFKFFCFVPRNDVFNSKKGPLSIKTKFGLFSIGIVTTFSFAAAMYSIWCPVGSDFIENLGGKYFIPIYPLFFLALPTIDVSKSPILTILAQPKVLFYTLCLSLIWSSVQVLSRYYE